jgi:hypothetical protein
VFTYIASGKDVHHECSMKVFGETDEEAFRDAKSALPVVSNLERIEEDGTLTPVTGLPYDDLNCSEVVDPQEVAKEKFKIRLAWRRELEITVVVVLTLIALEACNHWMFRASPTASQQPIPVFTPQK